MANFFDKIKTLFKNKNFVIGAASFMLPALALYIIFAVNGVHPFGDRQILVTDLWHQYYPFLCEMQEKLKTGASLLYSENIGMGINFWALIAYYCASPLNFLVMLVSKEALRDLLVVIVALKVGFSGLFFSMYLKKVFKRYDMSTVVFSMMYALCGYVLGYYWNIMWHDCVALLPLVMLGVYSLIKENKWKLYIISLAVLVISNFYIGFMVCIFTAIYFFTECAKSSMGFKVFLKKLGLIAACSAVALAMTAFITIPAYNALGDTVSSVPKTAQTEESFVEELGDSLKEAGKDISKDGANIIGRLASFNKPVPKEGLPNIFSGILSILLLGFFFTSKKIPVSEKLANLLMLIVLFLSLMIGELDIIWHGFHKPNMVPYRYAFVISFALITIAYRAYIAEFADDELERSSILKFIVPAVLTGLVILCAWKEASLATVLGCISISVIYFVILVSIKQEDKANLKAKWREALCCIMVLEVLINTVIAVPTVRTTVYSTYYYRGEEVERLLEDVDADKSYGRVETSQDYILNDPALYGYKGVSTFTSTANHNVTKFVEKIGLCAPARANRYYYQTTSPFTNAIFSVEHVIFKNDMKNLNPYLENVAEEWTDDEKYKNVIYKNREWLPMGFMADTALLTSDKIEGKNPFEVQNDLFRKMTGLEGDLFTQVPLKSVSSETTGKFVGGSDGKYTLERDDDGDAKLVVNYVAPDTNSIYGYVDCKDTTKFVVSNTTYKTEKRKYVFPAGSYPEGEKFSLSFTFSKSAQKKPSLTILLYSMDEKLFEMGMELLRDEPFEIETYKSTVIKGTVNAKDHGVFYTSIPYEKGWKLYVDGERADIEPLEDAFISTYLSKGEHDIVLRYRPYGFASGVIISIAALISFVVAVILSRRKKNG